jgi:hypothetical protein
VTQNCLNFYRLFRKVGQKYPDPDADRSLLSAGITHHFNGDDANHIDLNNWQNANGNKVEKICKSGFVFEFVMFLFVSPLPRQ